jgi:hypothetical protein
MIYFPNFPVLFSNIYFAYRKDELDQWTDDSILPFYICYRTFEYDDASVNISTIFYNNMACINSRLVIPSDVFTFHPLNEVYIKSISILDGLLRKYHLIYNYTSEICNRTNMYQYLHSSKCISLYRFMDLNHDCPYMNDENIIATNNSYLIEYYIKPHFQCLTSSKHIHRMYIQNDNCECDYNNDGWCEDEHLYILYLHQNIIFQHICDGFVDLYPIMIEGRNETDETECEQWSCNNIYTRCNGVWNCFNGTDEVDCHPYSLLNCSLKHHICVLIVTKELICLPIQKTNDGNIDFFGATDEPARCGKSQFASHMRFLNPPFYCRNQTIETCVTTYSLCDVKSDCEYRDDEQFCSTNNTIGNDQSLCLFIYNLNLSNVKACLRQYEIPNRMWGIIDFQLDQMTNIDRKQVKQMENSLVSSSSVTETNI